METVTKPIHKRVPIPTIDEDSTPAWAGTQTPIVSPRTLAAWGLAPSDIDIALAAGGEQAAAAHAILERIEAERVAAERARQSIVDKRAINLGAAYDLVLSLPTADVAFRNAVGAADDDDRQDRAAAALAKYRKGEPVINWNRPLVEAMINHLELPRLMLKMMELYGLIPKRTDYEEELAEHAGVTLEALDEMGPVKRRAAEEQLAADELVGESHPIENYDDDEWWAIFNQYGIKPHHVNLFLAAISFLRGETNSALPRTRFGGGAASATASSGGKKSRRKRTKKSRTIGGKKSRKLRKRTTIKGGKRKRRRTRRRR